MWDWMARHRTLSSLAGLALVIVLFALWLNQNPLGLLIMAAPTWIFFELISRKTDRQRKRKLEQLAASNQFECAIRSPHAAKDSLSERWAVGVATPTDRGFGFQHDDASGDVPQGPRKNYELLEVLGRKSILPQQARGVILPAATVGSYRTSREVLEVCADPADLAQLDAAADSPVSG